jgi:hypothetical protein
MGFLGPEASRFAVAYIVKPVNFEKYLSVADRIELYWCATNQPPR